MGWRWSDCEGGVHVPPRFLVWCHSAYKRHMKEGHGRDPRCDSSGLYWTHMHSELLREGQDTAQIFWPLDTFHRALWRVSACKAHFGEVHIRYHSVCTGYNSVHITKLGVPGKTMCAESLAELGVSEHWFFPQSDDKNGSHSKNRRSSNAYRRSQEATWDPTSCNLFWEIAGMWAQVPDLQHPGCVIWQGLLNLSEKRYRAQSQVI